MSEYSYQKIEFENQAVSELDILPSDVRAVIEDIDREAAQAHPEDDADELARYQTIRAYLLRVTAERDALRKRIEEAPVFVVNGGGVFTHSSGDANKLAAMRNRRAAIMALED